MDFTDPQLAVMVLVDGGASPAEAQAVVLANPGIAVSPERIEAKRAELAARVQAERDAAFAASPEGRRRAAFEAAQWKQEREQLVSAARDLLSENGIDASELDERRVLTLAGIEKRTRAEFANVRDFDREVEELASSWSRLSDDERRSECKRLDQDPALIARYSETFLGQAATSNANGGDAS